MNEQPVRKHIIDMDGRNQSKEKKDIRSLPYEKLAEWVGSLGEKPFRAAQLYDWMHKKGTDDFGKMTNLSAAFRKDLTERATLRRLEIVRVLESKLDETKKFLFRLEDGNLIESVWLKYHHGVSVCISSQVGCRMGCRFCASTLGGLERSLAPAEMLGQIYAMMNYTGEKVSNVVVMGTGEPLDNYGNLLTFIRILTDEHGLNISQRNLTVSTCGIAPKIKELAEKDLKITLALSLHAPTDEKRRELMPIANKYSLQEVLDACSYYFEKTGRRVSFEYTLVSGVNDNDREAEELVRLIGGMNCHVNLIPVNPIKERDFKSTSRPKAEAFQRKLMKNGITATIRRELGRDINGACGQLRREKLNV